jgi:hypothetical protein
MQRNTKGEKVSTITAEDANRQNSNVDNPCMVMVSLEEVHSAGDQKGRQHIFKYLLMADIECSSVGFTKRKYSCGATSA